MDGLCGQRRCHGGDRLRRLPARVVLFADRDAAFFAGLLMALTPQQIDVVGDSGGRALGVAGLVVALLCAALLSSVGKHRSACATAVRGRLCGSVPARVVLILPVVGLIVWPRLRAELETSSRLVGRIACSGAWWPFTSATCLPSAM